MNIAELRKEPHLSVSSVNDYIECGLYYEFSRIEHLEPEFKSEALVFGTTIHRVLADFYQEKMIGHIMSDDELQSLFETYWNEAEEDNSEIKYKEGRDFNTALDEGKALLKAFSDNYPNDNFNILAIEEPFHFYIDGLETPIVGYIDLIEEDENGTIIITDHKTSSRAYCKNDVEKNFQLTVYYMAAKAKGFSDREILLKFDCLIKTKTPKFEQYYTKRTPIDEKRAIKKITKVWEGIEQCIFIPDDGSWRCKDCSFRKNCDQWFIS